MDTAQAAPQRTVRVTGEGPSRGEFAHERLLAERVALVRLLLTLANFVVILLDHTVPSSGSLGAYSWAYGAALVFFLYAALVADALRRRKIELGTYERIAPLLDVLFASFLIVSTNGYLSPFNLWLVFALVSSGCGRYRMLPLITALLGLLAHCLIALVPQDEPLELTIFAVRSGYLFGFAAVLSTVTVYLTRQSRLLAIIERLGRELAATVSREAAARVLVQRVSEALAPAVVRLTFSDGAVIEESGSASMETLPYRVWPLALTGERLATLGVARRTPLTLQEASVVGVLCDRTASTLMRIRLSEELIQAAAAAERLRVADELHDTCLQSLAALDLRLEAARCGVQAVDRRLGVELAEIKQTARQVGTQVREILKAHVGAPEPSAAEVRKLLAERWPGEWQAEFEPGLELSAERWRAVEMLVKEGLHNAARHAQARRVALRLGRGTNGVVRCALENDGMAPVAEPRFGYGLSRLREVVEAVNGTLTLRGAGTGGAILVAEFR